MISLVIALVVFVVALFMGPIPLNNGAAFSLEMAAWSTVCLVAFGVIATKATSPKSPRDIFKD